MRLHIVLVTFCLYTCYTRALINSQSYDLRPIDELSMIDCEKIGRRVYPQNSGHSWRCLPKIDIIEEFDCSLFLPPLPKFVQCIKNKKNQL